MKTWSQNNELNIELKQKKSQPDKEGNSLKDKSIFFLPLFPVCRNFNS